MSEPHRCNVPGPFYVEDGCCTACGVTFAYAPDSFGWTPGEDHCFVARQPDTASDLDKMLQALWASEFDCVRYRGSDPAVLRRLAEMGAADQSDTPTPPATRILRDRAVFRLPRGEDGADVADRFRAFLQVPRDRWTRYHVRPRRRWSPCRVIFSWDRHFSRPGHFHRATFHAENGRGEVLLESGYLPASQGLALLVHEWLRDEYGAPEIRWFSATESNTGAEGLHVPF